ncbi:tetraketide alpha-pyrone reductase 1-like protein [Tanacetum coccineum]
MDGKGKVVCVTGASGFIASWLVKLLLARGYTVHATVRSLDDPNKTGHLLALDGAKERLSLFEVNLIYIYIYMHTLGRIARPAVMGTLNVLKSAAKVPSLKRVTLKSKPDSPFFSGIWASQQTKQEDILHV